jgi:acetyl-CoA C-acetyltransferase
MPDVVIVSACRTAIGAFGGTLKDSDAATIASVTMKAAVKRADIDPAIIDDVRYGCCMEPADTLNVSRVAALLAGIPDTVTAVTINRVCISGMEAVLSGMAMIQAGMADVILAGGVEHMSGVAYQVPNARWGCRLQDTVLVDAMIHALHCGSHIIPHPEDGPVDATQPPLSMCVGKPYIMGHTAEFIAQHMDISRKEMDEVALRSQNNAERANDDGSFTDEIVPIGNSPAQKRSAHLFSGRALPTRFDHATVAETAPGLRAQNRQSYRRQRFGHQRRLGGNADHVGGQGQGTGPSTAG